jgi:hypothetical protein
MREGLRQVKQAYSLFKSVRREISNTADRNHAYFPYPWHGNSTVIPVRPRITAEIFGDPLEVDKVAKKGGIDYAAVMRGSGAVSQTQQISVSYHNPQSQEEHIIAVKHGGSAYMDGERFLAVGIPFFLLTGQRRKERILQLAKQAEIGLSIADTIDSVTDKMRGSERVRTERLLLELRVRDFFEEVFDTENIK